MKKLPLAMAAMLVTGSAFAADIPRGQDAQPMYQPPAAAVTWTGFYAGANIGYGFAGDFNAGGVGSNVRLNEASGFTGGVQAGYNMQYDPIVVGIEGNLNYADITDSFAGARATAGVNGSITPRLGYAMGNFMPYVKAGLAIGDVELKALGTRNSQVLFGWTVGLGAEYRITPEVSVRAEYNYTDLPTTDYTLGSTAARAGFSGSDIKLGVNYHF